MVAIRTLCLAVGCALLGACGDDGGSPAGDGSTSDATTSSTSAGTTSNTQGETGDPTGGTGGPTVDSLGLLDPGAHLGMIVGFEEPAPGTEAAVDMLWQDAVAAGMDIARVQVDWADLEPTPGVYDLDELTQALDGFQADGLQTMVTLSTIDSLEFTVPDDLTDPNDPLALAGGVAFDDPLVTDRFAGLLDAMIPVVVDRGGFLITVGNEPDNAFADKPGFASEVAGFTAAARAHAATVDPSIAISMTITAASAEGQADSQEIIDAVDVVTWNIYCQGPDSQVLDPSTVPGRVDALLAASGDKPIVIQELGCPGGLDGMPSILGATPELQRAFFEAFAAEIQTEPRMRAAFVFQMLDWSPALAALFEQELLDAGLSQADADLFTEALSTLGLCRWSDATCRPAWDAVLAAIAQLAS